MQDPLPIRPFTQPVSGSVTLPGSKSITNRALLMAALCERPITLTGALFSEDTEIMSDSLRRLGFTVEADSEKKTIRVEGRGGDIPNAKAELYVGNAGTAARFLAAMLCLKEGGEYHLDGSEAMRKRPMRGLLDALVRHNAAEVTYHEKEGFFPFTLKTKGLHGGVLEVDATASSQILSALLMVAPLAKEALRVKLEGYTVSIPFVEMTLLMRRQFDATGGRVGAGEYTTDSFGYNYKGNSYPIEPDATAASYFLMLPWVVGGQLTVPGFANVSLQGDRWFVRVVEKLGARFQRAELDQHIEYPDPTHGGFQENFNAISDTFLTLAAVAPLLKSELKITGIAHTRFQETDRVLAMATELKKLGQGVTFDDDSLTVQPALDAMRALTADKPVEIDTYHDHRVAMSFGILGCYDLHGDGRPWLAIRNPCCCAKTFPNFFEVLDGLRGA